MTYFESLACQEEKKLSLALSKPKVTRELCDRLIREAEENEKEVELMLNKYQSMKSEMTRLHIQQTKAIEAQDRLQLIVDVFDQCSSEYELALNRIKSIEKQLCEASNKISQLEYTQHNITTSLNQSLFDDLVLVAPSVVSAASDIN